MFNAGAIQRKDVFITTKLFGTAIIARSASSPPSMQVFVDFNSTMPIAI